MSLNDPADQDNLETEVGQDLLRDILKYVAEKGAAFPSEIAARLNEPPKDIGFIMRELEDSGVLERLVPYFKGSDRRLLNRIPEMNRKGVTGIEDFRNRSWYGLNSDYNWFLYDNNTERFVDEYRSVLDADSKPVDCENPVRFAANKVK